MIEAAAAADPVQALLTPEAVRERCTALFDLARNDALPHFRLDLGRLDGAVDLVAAETAAAYPDGDVPLHSRWRHFELDGRDLWAEALAGHPGIDGADLARAAFDLAIVSVLLDAGAGAAWHYDDAGLGRRFARSEGLALASLRWFAAGGLSRHGGADPLRADAERLAAVTAADLAAAFQVSADNPLTGLDARADLMNRLGRVARDEADVFRLGGDCRPGHLFDWLHRSAGHAGVPARDILIAVLHHLGRIWPHGLDVAGVRIGDAGHHACLRRNDATDRVVPFHKLSQWLSYSLVEPLRAAGITVTGLDALTGLAEYRNGGLFLDLGVLALHDRHQAVVVHAIDSELIVEWRALTVALLDQAAAGLRRRLARSAEELPLGAVLQGGTWSAGRRIARKLRPDGAPPLKLASDGTVF